MAENINLLPSVFAESVYLHDGKPFRLTNRFYLKEIYDSEVEESMIMSGRQVEKSTTNAVDIANNTLLRDNFKALYVAPLTKQVSVFSKERLGRLYQYSQNNLVKRDYIDRHLTQNVGHKEFRNGSVNYLEHCFELGDNIRGISTNGIWFDELQDINIDAVPVVRETQSHALDSGAGMKLTRYTGTPKSFANTIQQYWDRSSQAEWVIRCQDCGSYQILGIKNMTPEKYLCRKCKGEIYKETIINGMWYHAKPKVEFKGYRISQMMVPWITPSDLWKKYKTYSLPKFHNECLGRSYENADKPFTRVILDSISANNFKLYQKIEGEFLNRHTFMGVDWGGGEKSYTIVTIFSINSYGLFQMIYSHKYDTSEQQDHEYQKKDIANLMSLFNIKYCIVDEGFGAVQYEWLRKRFGDRINSCYYSSNQGKKHKYDKNKARWVVNRSQVITDYVDFVREHRVAWPGAEKHKIEYIYEHHLNEYSEYRTSRSGRTEDLMYNHPEGAPDDGLHACIYAHLAYILSPKGGSGGIEFASAYGAR